MFPPNSRYQTTETATIERTGEPPIVYLRRRFVPAPGGTIIAEHLVTEGERIDNITARYLGDPELFWRVCDANNALRASELEAAVGRRLVIPLPQ